MLLPQHPELVAHVTLRDHAPDNGTSIHRQHDQIGLDTFGGVHRRASPYWEPCLHLTDSPGLSIGEARQLRSGVEQTQVLAKGSLRQVLTNQLDRPRLLQPFGLDIGH